MLCRGDCYIVANAAKTLSAIFVDSLASKMKVLYLSERSRTVEQLTRCTTPEDFHLLITVFRTSNLVNFKDSNYIILRYRVC